MSDVPEPIILREPMISKIFRKAKLLRALLAAWCLEEPVERLRLCYDLIIETFLSVPLKWADVCYMHSFPLAELPTYCINIEHLKLNLRERAYNSLIVWIARALADKTKPIIANSSWIAEHVKRAYGSQGST